jgi:hypothetical protein
MPQTRPSLFDPDPSSFLLSIGIVEELNYPDRVVVDQESEHGYGGEEDTGDFGSVSTAIERSRKARVTNRLVVSNTSRDKA